MKKDYIPGVTMHEECCAKTQEEIERVVRAASQVTIAAEKRRFLEQTDKTA
jgi:hypothetical protein